VLTEFATSRQQTHNPSVRAGEESGPGAGDARNWRYLIEAVMSHGPVSPKRYAELESVLKNCPAARVYVTAFMNFAGFKQFANQIVWESDVWIAETPDRMIHFNFNGDKCLGPYTAGQDEVVA